MDQFMMRQELPTTYKGCAQNHIWEIPKGVNNVFRLEVDI